MSKQLESILSRAPRATAEPQPEKLTHPTPPRANLKAVDPTPIPEPKSRDVSLGIEVPG